MDNLTLFLNGFLSYLVVFFVFLATIVIACLIGVALKKSKNAKMITEEADAADHKTAQE